MVGPVYNSPPRPSLTQRDRSPRFSVDLEASVEVAGTEAPAQIQDISATGVALVGEPPEMSNEQFLDLHVEGYDRLQGRIVREFAGGYAMQFDGDTGPSISEEELEAFRRHAASGG